MLKRVFVAMSGGVDSSVSALLLKEAGYEVHGIHLELYRGGPVEDHADLERTCRLLDIPLHFVNAEAEFNERVIEYFCDEYSRGRTPNPCIRCNRSIKFGLLLDKVIEMSGEYLATGHYARIEPAGAGYRLLKGLDREKDQSYFLYVLGQRDLARVLFPVGGLTKAEVKKMASDSGLPASTRRESQDICFIPGGDHREFLAARTDSGPGEITDMEGNILGKHRGLAHYTIGQRQGIGISSTQPLYVIELDVTGNRLIIGPREKLFRKSLTAEKLNWVAGRAPGKCLEIKARVRYRAPEVPATLQVLDDRAEVQFVEPQRAVAPGQAVVFYQGEVVLGGGTIAAAQS